jgi:hypothetical protein
MQRTLIVALGFTFVACAQAPSTPREQKTAEVQQVPAAPVQTESKDAKPGLPDKEEPAIPDKEPIRQPLADEAPPGMPDFFKSLERSGPVVGEVERVATLKRGFIKLLHEVEVAGEFAYVLDSGGTLFRAPISGGEFEVVHDSRNGVDNHAGLLGNINNEIYFSVDREGKQDEIRKVSENGVLTVASADDVIALAGDENHIFATYYQKNDIRKLGTQGLKLFVKTIRPGSPLVAGEHLYWAHYKSGRVHRVPLNNKKKVKQIARGRRVIGLAVVGDTLFYGTEKDGGIHTVPTSGGAAKRIANGFDNHDYFVSDDSGIYFWTWGRPGAVLRLDAQTHKVETMVSGVDATRGLALAEGWLYLVEGPDLFRVRTDTRMPWPMKADQ